VGISRNSPEAQIHGIKLVQRTMEGVVGSLKPAIARSCPSLKNKSARTKQTSTPRQGVWQKTS